MTSELANLLAAHIRHDGTRSTPIAGLHLYRESSANKTIPEVVGPTLALVAQGRKQLAAGDLICDYDPARFALISFNLPIAGAVTAASRSIPYLGLRLDLDTQLLYELRDAHQLPTGGNVNAHGLQVGTITPVLLESVIRMVRLLATPQDISALAPLYHKEILYRLLTSSQGAHLGKMIEQDSYTHRIARVMTWLKRNIGTQVSIPSLAKLANMSSSSFRQAFHDSAGMSPLQFQKRLRLQEARRLMLIHAKGVTSASTQVGYHSSSHFNRDYKQLYGDSPLREVQRHRDRALKDSDCRAEETDHLA